MTNRPKTLQTGALTSGQREIVEAPADAHVLVTAGPGTGKTHVLTHRIAHLVGQADLAPGSEILLLTFSRAAVGELRSRVRGLGGPSAWTRAYTFDSFASRLLRSIEPDGSWSAEGYDGRIRRATRMIHEQPDVAQILSEYRHVLVDELQDVVGVRADLVLAILGVAGCGWTLFGDPAQGIYNFQLEGEARREGAAALYRELHVRFRSSITERRLTENFRALTPGAQAGLWAGTELNDPAPEYRSIHRRLRTTLLNLPIAPPIGALQRLEGTVGILCPWNAHALLVSRDLWARGVTHRVRRAATDRVVPAWIATTLRGAVTEQVGRTVFRQLFALQSAPDTGVDEEGAWALLRRVDPGTANTSLNVGRVVSRIRTRDLPDDLVVPEEGPITVSTVHRSKGLEYDHVLVVAPPERDLDEVELPEEARMLYVALSRARSALYQMVTPDTHRMRTLDKQFEGRWIRHGFKKWHLRAFEVQPDDADRDVPAAFGDSDRTATETQEYLATMVCAGDPVDARLLRPGTYGIFHEGVLVGRTGAAFGAALGDTLYGPVKNWPIALHGLRVEGIDTVAGDEAACVNSGLVGPPLWLRVRVQGLGELEFEKKTSS